MPGPQLQVGETGKTRPLNMSTDDQVVVQGTPQVHAANWPTTKTRRIIDGFGYIDHLATSLLNARHGTRGLAVGQLHLGGEATLADLKRLGNTVGAKPLGALGS